MLKSHPNFFGSISHAFIKKFHYFYTGAVTIYWTSSVLDSTNDNSNIKYVY